MNPTVGRVHAIAGLIDASAWTGRRAPLAPRSGQRVAGGRVRGGGCRRSGVTTPPTSFARPGDASARFRGARTRSRGRFPRAPDTLAHPICAATQSSNARTCTNATRMRRQRTFARPDRGFRHSHDVGARSRDRFTQSPDGFTRAPGASAHPSCATAQSSNAQTCAATARVRQRSTFRASRRWLQSLARRVSALVRPVHAVTGRIHAPAWCARVSALRDRPVIECADVCHRRVNPLAGCVHASPYRHSALRATGERAPAPDSRGRRSHSRTPRTPASMSASAIHVLAERAHVSDGCMNASARHVLAPRGRHAARRGTRSPARATHRPHR
jgi:hypothetical protein